MATRSPKAEIKTGMRRGENKYTQASLEAEAGSLTDDRQTEPDQTDRLHDTSSAAPCPAGNTWGVREQVQGRPRRRTLWAPSGPPGLDTWGTQEAPAGLKARCPLPLGLPTLLPGRSHLAWPPKVTGQTPAYYSTREPATRGRGPGCGSAAVGRCGSLCGFSLKDSLLLGDEAESHNRLSVSAFPTDNDRSWTRLTLAGHLL